ncbi:fibronectin type III domain-containing protein [Nocardia sp. NPDC059246]|uniref:purple acid phosphatase family protein n=1 Tax=unclassified Nocardia TaxID=2637762 RepID=UPI0036C97D2A
MALRSEGGSGAAELWRKPTDSEAPAVCGVHLQYGADAAREAVVSWHTTVSVTAPRVRYGTPEGGLGTSVAARTRTYRDAKSGIEVQVHHARLTGLTPDTTYIYAAAHDGATPELGTLRTAPAGRAKFRFTSFGDQGTPTVGKTVAAPPNPLLKGLLVAQSDNLGTQVAGDITDAVERMEPLFNLVNGDLCYAALAQDRVRTWNDWFTSNGRSARNRPWMPAPGNHENELGNGPIGYDAFRTYFTVPDSGAEEQFTGLWYAFTVAGARIIALANDDVCYQDGGDTYVRGYSSGAQQRWLEEQLRSARADREIDWVIVVMHQTAFSTAISDFNGADLGIRESWLPLFDRYQVDLVLCGHEHHYERTYPVRGTSGPGALTPVPTDTGHGPYDTSKGTVHLVIGGGGTSAPSTGMLSPDPHCNVITGLGEVGPLLGKRLPTTVPEPAPWSAFRDMTNPYGFCCFDVDPGSPGGHTTITATYYALVGPRSEPTPVDTFTLTRPRP